MEAFRPLGTPCGRCPLELGRQEELDTDPTRPPGRVLEVRAVVEAGEVGWQQQGTALTALRVRWAAAPKECAAAETYLTAVRPLGCAREHRPGGGAELRPSGAAPPAGG